MVWGRRATFLRDRARGEPADAATPWRSSASSHTSRSTSSFRR